MRTCLGDERAARRLFDDAIPPGHVILEARVAPLLPFSEQPPPTVVGRAPFARLPASGVRGARPKLTLMRDCGSA